MSQSSLIRKGFGAFVLAVLALCGIVLALPPAQVALAAGNTCVWTGATDSDWNTAGNWTACGGNAPDAGDNVSSQLFCKILSDEDHHVDYLEGQLHIIKEVGLANYLAQQINR